MAITNPARPCPALEVLAACVKEIQLPDGVTRRTSIAGGPDRLLSFAARPRPGRILFPPTT